MVEIPVADGKIDGYLAKPEGAGPHPGVVVLHDAIGLGKDIKAIADRFAAGGYLALAPDLFSRGNRISSSKAVFENMLEAQGRAFDDIEAARLFLADQGARKVGVAGFGMGGGLALVAASAKFDAAAAYYGFLPKDMSIFEGAAPIVASYGKNDITLKGAASVLELDLLNRGVTADVKEYPEAGHGFATKPRLGALSKVVKAAPGHHAESAEDAWTRVTAFFAEHLR